MNRKYYGGAAIIPLRQTFHRLKTYQISNSDPAWNVLLQSLASFPKFRQEVQEYMDENKFTKEDDISALETTIKKNGTILKSLGWLRLGESEPYSKDNMAKSFAAHLLRGMETLAIKSFPDLKIDYKPEPDIRARLYPDECIKASVVDFINSIKRLNAMTGAERKLLIEAHLAGDTDKVESILACIELGAEAAK